MSWTRAIVNYAGGESYDLYHFLSCIAAGLAWALLLVDVMLYWFIIAPVLGWLTMLAWEVAQGFWDSGFNWGDIKSNTKALPVVFIIVNLIEVIRTFILA